MTFSVYIFSILCLIVLQIYSTSKKKSFDVVFSTLLLTGRTITFSMVRRSLNALINLDTVLFMHLYFKRFKAKKSRGYRDLGLVGNSHFFKE